MEVGDSGACGIGLPEGIRVGGGRASNNDSAAGYRGGHLAHSRSPWPNYRVHNSLTGTASVSCPASGKMSRPL